MGISLIVFEYYTPAGISGLSDYDDGWNQLTFKILSTSSWVLFFGNIFGSLLGKV